MFIDGRFASAADLTGWLAGEEQRLIDLARRSRTAVGFGYLGDDGSVVASAGHRVLVTARMTEVFATAALRGDDGAREDARHGVMALLGPFWDDESGGWLSRYVAPEEHTDPLEAALAATSAKSAHDHASVLLAAATADAAGIAGAGALLERAATVMIDRFWSEQEGALVDAFSRDWTSAEEYRGARSNMRFVEAALAVHEVTGDAVWLDRARRVAERLVGTIAAGHGWRIVEHFDAQWNPDVDYRVEYASELFRPVGWNVEHSMQWARLLVELGRALRGVLVDAEWMFEAAACLFGVAMDAAWQPGSTPGFVATLDWDDSPLIVERTHTVITTTILAVWALHEELGNDYYLQRYRALWGYARRHFVDETDGSWLHELGRDLRPTARLWSGRPELSSAYKAVVAELTPRRCAVRQPVL